MTTNGGNTELDNDARLEKRTFVANCPKDIATRRRFASEEKIRIVLEDLRGEDSIAELCRAFLSIL